MDQYLQLERKSMHSCKKDKHIGVITYKEGNIQEEIANRFVQTKQVISK